MHSRMRGLLSAVLLVVGFVSTNVWADASADEDSTRANTDKELSNQGDRTLGDMVDLNTGALSFSQTDLTIPGNNSLTVGITRRFDSQRTRALNNPASSLSFYDWQIDVPRVTTTLATSNPWPSNRCSSNWVPPVLNTAPGVYVNADQYSGGFKIEFPGGSAQMLIPSNTGFPRPSNFTWVAAGNIGVSCTTATNPNGSSAGEGFTVWLPDGTHYDMTLHTVAQALNLKNPPDGEQKGTPIVYRQVESLMATRATDRFGNTVTYGYDSAGKLTSISSSDGRALTIVWTTYNSSPVIDHVTDGSRTWTYGYGNNELSTVTRPDGSQWHFSLAALAALNPGAPNPAPLGFTGTVTSPYGLTGTFNMGFAYNPWANVTPLGVPTGFATSSIATKQLSGPGIPLQTWTYNYNFDEGWYANNGTPWSETKSLDVVDPTGVTTRSTYNINYDWREGQLEKTEVFPAGSTTPIETTTYSYVQIAPIGGSPLGNGINLNIYREGEHRRMTSMTKNVNGDSYTTQINAVDAYKNPTSMTVSNSFTGTTLTMVATYQNSNASYSPWVIGAMTSMAVNGVYASQTTLNSLLQPQGKYAFGLLKSTTNYTPDGLPQTVYDGLNHATGMSNFYRGKPQTITRADTHTLSMVVNPTGTIASMTDALGNTTSMGYDGLLRPTSITYPASDTVAWDSSSTVYSTLTALELGMPVGTFRTRTITGTNQKTTYYDAMLRPLLVEMKDNATGGNTIYMRKTYDALGRVTFMSYPWATYDTPSGINMSYDTLNRMVQEVTTDNVTLKTVSYLSSNRMQVTDADGKTITTAFQAFGAPAYKNPLVISAPVGQTTTMSRDIFGNLLSAVQGSVSQSWVYDANYQLCKKVESETGQTVYQYDADGKMLWSVAGYPGTPTSCDNGTEPSNSIHYSYDVLDRMTLAHYSDGTGDSSIAYDLDGHVITATNPTASWTYGYNKRGLMETESASIDGNAFSLRTTYNTRAQVLSETYPDGLSVSYTPDAFGRPTRVGSYASGVQYFPNGTPSNYTLGSGLTVATTLNSRQVPATMQVLQGATPLQSVTYRYSNELDVDQITDNVDGSDSATLVYDDLHRLTSATGLWGGYIYGYDTNNNITSRTGSGGTLTYNYVDGTNRLNSISGIARNYGYDTRGRATSDGVRSYTWNDADEITVIPGVATYGYDAMGKRIRAVNASTGAIEYALYDASGRLMFTQKAGTHTDYLDLNGKPLAEVANYIPASGCGCGTNGATQTQGFTPASALPGGGSAGTVTYLHPDLLGSPRMATNSTKQVLWREHYDPYGVKLNGVAEKIGYAGHAFDPETGLTYAQARYYDAAVGRFMSADPMRFAGNDPFNFNRYGYANENPYKYTDPTGGSSAYDSYNIRIISLHVPGEGDGDTPAQDQSAPIAKPLGAAPEQDHPSDKASSGIFQGDNEITRPVEIAQISFGLVPEEILPIERLGALEDTPSEKLPSNPEELLKQGYDETSHPDAAKAGHRTFENLKTGDKLRFDKGKDGAFGHEGKDHYHRYNPNSTGRQDEYLDRNGEPVRRGSDDSHLYGN